ncbi:MAG: GDP-mannose 4,6-dehydratase [Phycisphaerales bacterium]|nr:MAG: GDP-mannose 4,6-dehydratase [Phycisphaerales bacterium]
MATKILVTGAGGFIGSHLVEQLVMDGHDVCGFVHYNAAGSWHNLEKLPSDILNSVEVVAGDIADPYFVDNAVAGCDIVFHLAALIGIPYSYIAPQMYVSTNVNGTLNVLEACRRHGVSRMVHTSTSETYGSAQYIPIDEKHPLVGQSPYSASKIGADTIAESYYRSFNLPVCIIRPFNTYGPRQSARAFIPTVIAQAICSDVVRLGNLDPIRDMTFVKDTVGGFIAGANSDQCIGTVCNLGVGQGQSIGELVERIGVLLGKDLQVETDPDRVRPAKSEVSRLISNNSKIKELAGWEPSVSFVDGLQETIEYIRENIGEYRVEQYNV